MRNEENVGACSMELTLDVGRETRESNGKHCGEPLATVLPAAVKALTEARSGDAVFVVDPDYRIVYWDTQAESLTGLLAEETVGRPCYEVVRGRCEGGGSFCSRECSVMRLSRAGRPVDSYEMRVFTRSGTRWFNVSNISVDSEEGTYLVHLMRDAQKAHETLEMAQKMIQLSSANSAPAPDRRDIPALTPRQLEVLALLAEGETAKKIGRELYLSEATVRNHIRSLLQALGVHSQLEALSKAYKTGLLTK
jgi:PAS domain S-box-containing protein